MKKVLIVGLGGSGGKTLGFIMDELKVILKDNGWTKESLPECWKFVHIDVPSKPDTKGKGLAATVESQGGKYVGLANRAKYPPYDRVALENFGKSPNGLRSFARWRPDPVNLGLLDLEEGAGQFRAVGRVVTITKAEGIYSALDEVVTTLRSVQAGSDLQAVSSCFNSEPDEDEKPIVLMVSSMAGGSGASMVLDVADILRGIQPQKFGGDQTAAFLYTADVFRSMEEVYKGAATGTLATLSELTNALSAFDTSFTEGYWKSIVPNIALQKSDAQGRGPKLVYPIGSETRGIRFGNSPEEVYRGFSKMLSPVFYSEDVQNSFGAYAQGNWGRAVINLGGGNRDKLGLITKRFDESDTAVQETAVRPMLFPTWGSASLTMGRNRYKEYAAQRIGREMATILQEGFRRTGSTEIGLEEAISNTAEAIYPTFLDLVDLGGDGTRDWQQNGKLTISILRRMGENKTLIPSIVSRFLEGFTGTRTAIVNKLKGKLAQDSAERERQLSDLAIVEVQSWLNAMTQRLDNAVLFSLSRGGFETTKRVLEKFRGELTSLQTSLTQSAGASIAPAKEALAGTLNRNASSSDIDKPGSVFFRTVNDNFTSYLKAQVTEKTSLLLADVVGEVSNKLITEMTRKLETSRAALSAELQSEEEMATSAAYRDAPIKTWPRGSEVPSHFKPTVNEVVITSSEEFDAAFSTHISAEGGSSGTDSLREIAELVLFRKFLVSGGKTQPKVGLTSEPKAWHPSLESNSSTWKIPKLNNGATSDINYSFKFSSKNLRELAFEYVSITGSSFEIYTRESLSDWIKSDPANEEVFGTKLGQAISYASPLVGIDSNAVEIFHGSGYEYTTYRFSDIPISESSRAIQTITTSFGADPAAVLNARLLKSKCTPASAAKEIFITSDTPPYLPWVFSSLTKPVRDSMAMNESAPPPVWTNVRGRQLREFIPLGSDLVAAFLRGWIIGRITGLIQEETSSEDRPHKVKVFSPNPTKKGFSTFSTTTLGVKKLGQDGKGNSSIGFNIPAVLLETLPLALANASSDMSVLQPYLDLIELGSDMKVVGGMDSHKVTALDLWFVKKQDWPETQLPFQKEDGSAISVTDRHSHRGAANDWLEKNHAFLAAVDAQKISEEKFWHLNPEYEIAKELMQAIKKVQEELGRPDLGEVQVEIEVVKPSEETEEPEIERPAQ
jgi:hypothetical protein